MSYYQRLINSLIAAGDRPAAPSNTPSRPPVESLREAVASMVTEANASVAAPRRVSLQSAYVVAERTLGATAGRPLEQRAFAAIRAVNRFLSVAANGAAADETVEHADLLAVAHPSSTAYHAMTASALYRARAQWFAADPRLDSDAAAIVASAYAAPHGSVERAHGLTRLAAHPTPVPTDLVLDAMNPIVAGLLSFGGNSSAAKSARARAQRRDGNGRFAYMGGLFKFLGIDTAGRVFSNLLRVVAEPADSKVFEFEVENDGDVPGLKKGIYPIANGKAYAVRARLNETAEQTRARLAGTTPTAKQARNAVDLNALAKLRKESPTGWDLVEAESGVTVRTFKSDDGYTVVADSSKDGKTVYTLKRTPGADSGLKDSVVGTADSWYEVQSLALGDQDAYEAELTAAKAGKTAKAATTKPAAVKGMSKKDVRSEVQDALDDTGLVAEELDEDGDISEALQDAITGFFEEKGAIEADLELDNDVLSTSAPLKRVRDALQKMRDALAKDKSFKDVSPERVAGNLEKLDEELASVDESIAKIDGPAATTAPAVAKKATLPDESDKTKTYEGHDGGKWTWSDKLPMGGKGWVHTDKDGVVRAQVMDNTASGYGGTGGFAVTMLDANGKFDADTHYKVGGYAPGHVIKSLDEAITGANAVLGGNSADSAKAGVKTPSPKLQEPATEAQTAFIKKLLDSSDTPDEVKAPIAEALAKGDLTKGEAGVHIAELKKYQAPAGSKTKASAPTEKQLASIRRDVFAKGLPKEEADAILAELDSPKFTKKRASEIISDLKSRPDVTPETIDAVQSAKNKKVAAFYEDVDDLLRDVKKTLNSGAKLSVRDSDSLTELQDVLPDIAETLEIAEKAAENGDFAEADRLVSSALATLETAAPEYEMDSSRQAIVVGKDTDRLIRLMNNYVNEADAARASTPETPAGTANVQDAMAYAFDGEMDPHVMADAVYNDKRVAQAMDDLGVEISNVNPNSGDGEGDYSDDTPETAAKALEKVATLWEDMSDALSEYGDLNGDKLSKEEAAELAQSRLDIKDHVAKLRADAAALRGESKDPITKVPVVQKDSGSTIKERVQAGVPSMDLKELSNRLSYEFMDGTLPPLQVGQTDDPVSEWITRAISGKSLEDLDLIIESMASDREAGGDMPPTRAGVELALNELYEVLTGLPEQQPKSSTELAREGNANPPFTQWQVPVGYYSLENEFPYVPTGANFTDSPDYTDDPEVLATKFPTSTLVTEYVDALIAGLDQVPLEFENGTEYVPVEAVYEALKRADRDADAITAMAYDGALRKVFGGKSVDANIKAVESARFLAANPGSKLDDVGSPMVLPTQQELASKAKVAADLVAEYRDSVIVNPNFQPIADFLRVAQEFGAARALNNFMFMADSDDPEEREAFRGLIGLLNVSDGGDGLIASMFTTAYLAEYPDNNLDDARKLLDKVGGNYADLLRSKNAVADGTEDPNDPESVAGASYRLASLLSEPTTEMLYRGLPIELNTDVLAQYTTVGNVVSMDLRPTSSEAVIAESMMGFHLPEGDSAALLLVFPPGAQAVDMRNISPHTTEYELLATGDYRVANVVKQEGPEGGVLYAVQLDYVDAAAATDAVNTPNGDYDVPEGMYAMSLFPYEPEGTEDDPQFIADRYEQDVLETELFDSLVNGTGVVNLRLPNGNERTVDSEAVRDALKIQGVDTNELVRAAYDSNVKPRGAADNETATNELSMTVNGEVDEPYVDDLLDGDAEDAYDRIDDTKNAIQGVLDSGDVDATTAAIWLDRLADDWSKLGDAIDAARLDGDNDARGTVKEIEEYVNGLRTIADELRGDEAAPATPSAAPEPAKVPAQTVLDKALAMGDAAFEIWQFVNQTDVGDSLKPDVKAALSELNSMTDLLEKSNPGIYDRLSDGSATPADANAVVNFVDTRLSRLFNTPFADVLEEPFNDLLRSVDAFDPTTGESSAPDVTTDEVFDISDWKKVGDQLGSNEGGTYESPDGRQYYVKKAKSESHLDNEVLASKLYEALGVDVVRVSKGVDADGNAYSVSPIVGTNGSTFYKELSRDPAFAQAFQEGYAIDAWLGNWDVAGLAMDNVIVGKNGSPVRVDTGGALEYRAQGEPKGAAFGDEVTELDSLLDPSMNQQSARAFDGIDEDTKRGSAALLGKRMTDDRIDEIVDSVMSGPAATEMKRKLKARRDDIVSKLAPESTQQDQSPTSILDRVRENGGLTVNPLTDEEPTTGYVVAVQGYNREVPASDFFDPEKGPQLLAQYVLENREALLANEGHHLGLWHDTKNDEVVFDVVEVFGPDRRDEAVQAGVDRNQQSIYDIENGTEIETGGTGDRAAEDTTEPAAEPSGTTEGPGDGDGAGDSGLGEAGTPDDGGQEEPVDATLPDVEDEEDLAELAPGDIVSIKKIKKMYPNHTVLDNGDIVVHTREVTRNGQTYAVDVVIKRNATTGNNETYTVYMRETNLDTGESKVLNFTNVSHSDKALRNQVSKMKSRAAVIGGKFDAGYGKKLDKTKPEKSTPKPKVYRKFDDPEVQKALDDLKAAMPNNSDDENLAGLVKVASDLADTPENRQAFIDAFGEMQTYLGSGEVPASVFDAVMAGDQSKLGAMRKVTHLSKNDVEITDGMRVEWVSPDGTKVRRGTVVKRATGLSSKGYGFTDYVYVRFDDNKGRYEHRVSDRLTVLGSDDTPLASPDGANGAPSGATPSAPAETTGLAPESTTPEAEPEVDIPAASQVVDSWDGDEEVPEPAPLIDTPTNVSPTDMPPGQPIDPDALSLEYTYSSDPFSTPSDPDFDAKRTDQSTMSRPAIANVLLAQANDGKLSLPEGKKDTLDSLGALMVNDYVAMPYYWTKPFVKGDVHPLTAEMITASDNFTRIEGADWDTKAGRTPRIGDVVQIMGELRTIVAIQKTGDGVSDFKYTYRITNTYYPNEVAIATYDLSFFDAIYRPTTEFLRSGYVTNVSDANKAVSVELADMADKSPITVKNLAPEVAVNSGLTIFGDSMLRHFGIEPSSIATEMAQIHLMSQLSHSIWSVQGTNSAASKWIGGDATKATESSSKATRIDQVIPGGLVVGQDGSVGVYLGNDTEMSAPVTSSGTSVKLRTVGWIAGPRAGKYTADLGSTLTATGGWMTAEQAKRDFNVEVDPEFETLFMDPTGETLKYKIDEVAAEAKAKEAKEALKNRDTEVGPGVEPDMSNAPADWSQSAFEAIPSLTAALDTAHADPTGQGRNGVPVLVDAADIEDVQMSVHEIVVDGGTPDGVVGTRVRYQLTSWAGDKLAESLTNEMADTPSGDVELHEFSLPHMTTVNGALHWEWSKYYTTGQVDPNGAGATWMRVLYDDANEPIGTMLLHRATQDVKAPGNIVFDKDVYHDNQLGGPLAYHNRVELVFGRRVSPEEIAKALEQAGVRDARPASQDSVRVVNENKLITMLSNKNNGARNLVGQAREDALDAIAAEWDVDASMILPEVLPNAGRITFVAPESFGVKMAEYLELGVLQHVMSFKTPTGGPMDDSEKKEFIMSLLTGSALMATTERRARGGGNLGMSSNADGLRLGGGHVFFSPNGQSANGADSKYAYGADGGYGAMLRFDARKVLRRLDWYANDSDHYGSRFDESGVETIKNTLNKYGGHANVEFMLKGAVSWADMFAIDLPSSELRAELVQWFLDNKDGDFYGRPATEVLKNAP